MSEDKTTYIKLLAPINEASTQRLFSVVEQKVKQGFKKIVLLLSTPGGSVLHGISIHNLLKGLPIEVVTHNFGSVDSIGVVIFCAGSKRYSVKDARFLLHPISAGINGNFEREKLQEILNGLDIDTENIASVISHTISKTKNEVISAISERTTLNPQKAKDFGLINEINNQLIAEGADFTFITL